MKKHLNDILSLSKDIYFIFKKIPILAQTLGILLILFTHYLILVPDSGFRTISRISWEMIDTFKFESATTETERPSTEETETDIWEYIVTFILLAI